MSSPSALWLFAHRGLAAHFHQDPKRFVEILDGREAGGYLEHTWRWALEVAKQSEPGKPGLKYGIDRPRPGLAVVWMAFDQAAKTGEPWHARFIVRDADPPSGSQPAGSGYARMFMLEHSEYASELSGTVEAIVCETLPDGRHRNFGTTMTPIDESSFDRFVIEVLRSEHAPAAEYAPPSSVGPSGTSR